jgi:hypothetical protein
MRRWEFILGLRGAAAWPLVARRAAARADAAYRSAHELSAGDAEDQARNAAFLQAQS